MSPSSSGYPDCRWCRNFVDDPLQLERELPGLTALSSGFGDSRGASGICLRKGVLQDPLPRCDDFTPRPRTR